MLIYRQKASSGDYVERPVEELLQSGETAFQKYELLRLANGGLAPVLDGDIQSVAEDEGVYHEGLVHLPMLFHPNPKTVLIMGGGEGATAREVLKHRSVERVVMVDIDKEFVDLCRAHLASWGQGAFEDPRLELKCEDINKHLAETADSYDVIVGDLIDVVEDQRMELYSEGFFSQMCARLAPDGVFGSQAGPISIRLSRDGQTGVKLLRERMAALLPNAMGAMIGVPNFYEPWGFFVAARTPLERDVARRVELFERHVADRGVALPYTGARHLAAAFETPAWVAT